MLSLRYKVKFCSNIEANCPMTNLVTLKILYKRTFSEEYPKAVHCMDTDKLFDKITSKARR